jgi:hypothetical protein
MPGQNKAVKVLIKGFSSISDHIAINNKANERKNPPGNPGGPFSKKYINY